MINVTIVIGVVLCATCIVCAHFVIDNKIPTVITPELYLNVIPRSDTLESLIDVT